MNKERFTLVEIIFRFKDGEWNSDDVRIKYSDKPFEKVNHTNCFKFNWIALQMIVSRNKTIEDTKQSIREQFEIVREKIDEIDDFDTKVKLLTDYGIKYSLKED